MPIKKQNLFLFFEENENEFDISSNLVRLSMNRFTVDEEAQFEIIGVHNLRRVKKEMMNERNPDYKKFAKERTEKEAFDRDLISDAMEKALLHQTTSADAHFIIGSAFHLLNYINTAGIRASLFDWISSEIKEICLKSMYCTIYFGSRVYLITKELADGFHNGKILTDGQKQTKVFRFSQEIFNNMKSSINDDLEDLVEQIRNGCRPSMNLSNELVMLYLHKMITKTELKKVRNSDSQFLNSLAGQGTTLHKPPVMEPDVSYEDFVKIHKPKFIFCFGRRLTTLLK